MSDNPQHDDVLETPVAPRKRRRRWPWIVVGVLVVLPALLYAAWAAITLNYTYADDGQRAARLGGPADIRDAARSAE